jgi:four helix bundle suffix protein
MRSSGGYRQTCSFQTATLIYDATVWFCGKFLEPRSRTVDQMLMNVARSSLEELLLDYEDFLRHRRLVQWAPDGREALAVRRVPQRFKQDQTNYLLDQQIAALEKRFVEEGGYKQLAAARLAHRVRQPRAADTCAAARIPDCPQCGKPMVLRTAKSGQNVGSQFWGCSAYPDCKG